MKKDIDHGLIKAIEKHAVPLGGSLCDYDPIIQAAHNKIFVMIGEASHGTKEFYRARAEITERLIQELGFDAVAVEADWPDAYRVNRHVSLLSDESAGQSLSDFERFPTWMWRNKEVFQFIEWLQAYNYEFRQPGPKSRWPIGFYGLDLYSMSTSIHAVIKYLDKIDPMAARRARMRYGCLDHFMDNPQAYGYAAEFGLADSCERDIIDQLIELRMKAYEYTKKNGFAKEDDYFSAEQNAKLVKSAEKYYRAMFRGRPNSWNLRDKHMFETLEDLADHLGNRLGRNPRIIVWAHNSHIGNAGATEMHDRGEFNIGQLVRSAYKDKALLVGFSTCRGTVTAADNWDEPAKTKRINDPFPGSYEEIFHHVNYKAFLLDLRESNEAVDGLMTPRLQRAIGVIYRPDTERHSHYFNACLPEQFDFMLHYDDTHAVEPLESVMHAHHGEMDETYPSGL
ncbi:MAG: erythromycin esterase family protein [Micavibrio sp.]